MVEVREARLDDMETLCDIYRNDGAEHPKPLESYPLMDWIVTNSHVLLVATMKERPVGFVLVRAMGDEAKIDMISVQANFQNKGIEKQLLDGAEAMVDVASLRAYVPKEGGLAAVYRKSGYAVKDETPNLYGPGRNGLLMVKDLTEVPIVQRKKRKARPQQQKPLKIKVIKPKSVYKTKAQQLSENLAKLEELSDEA